MLSNPIYYGHFKYRGEVHEGKHEPIISKQLFDAAQAVFDRRWRCSPQIMPRVPKVFLGLLQCRECGGAITAEIQKGHTYYRCTKKNRIQQWCNQPYVREEVLDQEISALLKQFALPEGWAENMLKRLQDEEKQLAQSSVGSMAERRSELERINLKLQKLLDSYLDGIVERDCYIAEKEKLMSRKKTLEEQSSVSATSQNAWLEPFRKWIKTLQNIEQIAMEGSREQKKALAREAFGSNLTLDSRKLNGDAVKPWLLRLEKSSMDEVGGLGGT